MYTRWPSMQKMEKSNKTNPLYSRRLQCKGIDHTTPLRNLLLLLQVSWFEPVQYKIITHLSETLLYFPWHFFSKRTNWPMKLGLGQILYLNCSLRMERNYAIWALPCPSNKQQRFIQWKSVSLHQVGAHACNTSWHSCVAMHKDFPFSEAFGDKIWSVLKILC